MQARPASAGSELKPYLLRDGVDDAMQMTPDYLVVGEVRDGQAAQGLFRAMMSDHPGMSTFYAESPELAVERIALLLEADTGTGQRSARKMFSSAVDWLLQIGFDPDGKRRKERKAPPNATALSALKAWLAVRPSADHLFVFTDKGGLPLRSSGIQDMLGGPGARRAINNHTLKARSRHGRRGRF